MIKLKDIIKESKVSHLITEKFKSSILQKLSKRNNWSLDRDLYTYLAKLGIKASEIKDSHINKLSKLPTKGIAIAVTSKKVTLPAKGNSYWRSDAEIEQGVVMSVFNNGKAMWFTRSWREKDVRVGNPTSYGSEDYRTFGLNKFGYQSAGSVKKIPGIVFFQILSDDDLPYMGAVELRNLRLNVKDGSWEWRDDKDFKNENERRYSEALKRLYDDPAKVKGLVKKAKDYTNKIIIGLVGGKPNAQSDAVLKGKKLDPTDEADTMRVLKDITTAMNKLYEKLDYYSNDLERDILFKKENPESSGRYSAAPEKGKEIAQVVSQIMKNQFGRIW